jgi:hypothetical protein
MAVLTGACGEAPPVPAADARADSVAARFPSVRDSLVLTAPDGTEVWFTQARRGIDTRRIVSSGAWRSGGRQRALVPS